MLHFLGCREKPLSPDSVLVITCPWVNNVVYALIETMAGAVVDSAAISRKCIFNLTWIQGECQPAIPDEGSHWWGTEYETWQRLKAKYDKSFEVLNV